MFIKNFVDSESAQKEGNAKTYERLAKHYDYMNCILQNNGDQWFLGEKSFADTFLYVLSRWIKLTPLSIHDYESFKSHSVRMEADEGVKLALDRQSMKPLF
ncbi:glutathione S-transferase family protein [Nitrosomonas supralitoralis]|uniref:Glutathione S-transferase C-terminal domain-containing protein n=1 Tax=Nitrosomonas supralitoralis TaxID=2116706 RepID=A0A2P7NR59_9PROT|nr:glutathione S-transferase family protein [Nitrosomonas supralitoralis]PSJ15944.1 hypothetical protein C7H79_16265 [Nitrosomonas supralitoralis]